jgi:peptide/nickel transport system substrate-binding protein
MVSGEADSKVVTEVGDQASGKTLGGGRIMRQVCFLAALFLAVLAPFQYEAYPAATEKPRYGGVLRIGLRKDITNLNPLADLRSTNGLVHSLVYENLVEVNQNLEVVPSLAESWTISKDGTEYVFQLKKGVLFHHGKEMDAEDVKWTLEYVLDRKNRGYARGSLSAIDTVEVLDKYSVRLTLKQPFAPFLAIGLSAGTGAVILPKNAVPVGGTLSVAAPGTGPFVFVEWKIGSEIRQVAHKRYRTKGVPYLSELVLKPAPSADVRLISLRAGDFDVIEEVPYPIANDIKAGKYPDVKLSAAPVAGFRMIKINVEAPYFKDPRVRRAIAHAIDRKAYIEGAAFGHAQPAYQAYPKGWKWHFDEVKNIEMDLERARSLLAEAGYPNGFKTTLQVRQGEEAENLMLQNQLKKIGIDLELQSMDFAGFLKSHADGTFGMVISGSDVYADIDRSLYHNFRSEPGPVSTRNHTRYKNVEVDRLLDRARIVSDPQERRDLYKKATEIIMSEIPWVNLAFITRYYGYRNLVKGFATDANGDIVFPEGGIPFTWIEREGK